MIIKPNLINAVPIKRYSGDVEQYQANQLWFVIAEIQGTWYIVGRHNDCGYRTGEVFHGDWKFMTHLSGKKVDILSSSFMMESFCEECTVEEQKLIGLI